MFDAVDLFAGPGGWDVAARGMGLHTVGLELDAAACATRAAAGHPTIRCDVAQYPPAPFAGVRHLIASPVCPPFGKSGKKLGLVDLPHVQQAIDDLAAGRDTRSVHGAACLDPRSILTAEPMRYLAALRPETVCLEQVPSVLPVWHQYTAVLGRWGYSTAAGILDAADYGLGQHRRRAILVASRTRDVHLPEPSHGPGLFTQPHIAMADVINWGYTQRPAPTVTGGGTATGGAEPFGNGTRRAMRAATGTPAWSGHPRGVTRPTIAECAALQGFPADYPWQGRAGQQYLQVGNAVPPLLAAAVLTAATGITTAAPATLLAA